MIKRLIQKLKYEYSKSKMIWKTRYKKRIKSSDYERWSQSKSLFSSWDERTQLLAQQVLANSIVFEFGAARFVLRDALPKGCTYLHSDIVSRDKETVVVDLNKEYPQLPKVDYIIFSGVLEYIFEVERMLIHLSQYTDHFIFSYATTNAYPEISNRRFNGWVSDLSEADIKHIAEFLDWKWKVIGHWKQQTLYHFSK